MALRFYILETRLPCSIRHVDVRHVFSVTVHRLLTLQMSNVMQLEVERTVCPLCVAARNSHSQSTINEKLTVTVTPTGERDKIMILKLNRKY